VANLDFVERTSEQRAQLLKKFGIRHYAYLAEIDAFGMRRDINTSQLDVEAEISAMKRNGINVRGWYFWFNADDPAVDPRVVSTFEAFARHQIQPQIWLPQSFALSASKTHMVPRSEGGFPADAESQRQRVKREADRIAAWAKLAAPYGCKVNLYNHQDWYGMMDNQLAILDRLRELGIPDVGLVYNFGHSASIDHDDATEFPDIWRRIQPHVVTLNMAVYTPRELGMLRVIHESGWHGPVGMMATVGNAELSIPNQLWTIEWAIARIQRQAQG
jgi:hypothetical protein